ncbi:MAG: GNAT family N-acetyltransferase [Planctomycetota bacterium]
MSPRLRHARLVGKRVELVPLEAGYAERAFAMLHNNEAILRWLVWDGPTSLEDLREFYCRWIVPTQEGDDYHFAILDRETGAFAGSIGPRFAGHRGIGDVGYWLAPEFWGRGLMTDAVRLVNYLAFRYLAATAMTAYVFVGNDGSRRVLENAGYAMLHVAKAKAVKRGEPVDEWYFSLLRHEFERDSAEYRPIEETVEYVL